MIVQSPKPQTPKANPKRGRRRRRKNPARNPHTAAWIIGGIAAVALVGGGVWYWKHKNSACSLVDFSEIAQTDAGKQAILQWSAAWSGKMDASAEDAIKDFAQRLSPSCDWNNRDIEVILADRTRKKWGEILDMMKGKTIGTFSPVGSSVASLPGTLSLPMLI